MTWIEEVSYNYRENEYFFVDLPAIFQYCLPALFIEFIRLCVLQVCVNFLYQLITTDVFVKGRQSFKNVLSSLIGALLLLYFYPLPSVGGVLILLVLSYFLIADKKLVFFILSSAVATGWFTGWLSINFRELQGPLMILAMKIITTVNVAKEQISFTEFLHYSLSPSSVVFGPIVPYDEFKQKVFQNKFSFPFRAFLNVLAGTFLTFIAANCICQSVEWVYNGQEIIPYHVRFLTAYKQALEFRMSHYFICYLSSLQMTLGSPKLASDVADFWSIEVPRSTKHVVRAWNLPMHRFLKKYVFQKIRPTFGSSISIVLTFLISAGLHLFEIRVTVVLFGLSLVSVIESRLELHLPKSFAELWMRTTTFIHLVFFGCIMMGHDEEQDGTYFQFVMEKWHELGFVSFKILVAEAVLCILFELWRLVKGGRGGK